MAKTIQLCRNGELSMFCRTRTVCGSGPTMNHQHVSERPRNTTRVGDWSEASVPVLSGPHSSRPWATSLRRLLKPHHLLN